MPMEVQDIQEPLFLAPPDYLSIRSLLCAIGGNLGVCVESIKICFGYRLSLFYVITKFSFLRMGAFFIPRSCKEMRLVPLLAGNDECR